MKGLTPRKADLVKANERRHFKMYKAGIRWVTTGISMIGGLFGMGTIGAVTTAKAATTLGVAQQVAPDDVAATQTSGQIPATSGSTTSVTTAVTSESVSSGQPATTSETSVALTGATTATQESVSVVATAVTSVSATSTASQSASPVTSQSGTRPAPANQAATTVRTKAVGAVIGATQEGQQAAQQDLDGMINQISATGSKIVGGIFDTAMNTHVATGHEQITANVQAVSNLLDDYQRNQSLQQSDQQGTPVWSGNAYAQQVKKPQVPADTTLGQYLSDYNQGYVQYLQAYVQGVNGWTDGIKAKAKNIKTANALIDAHAYNAGSMTGASLQGEISQGLGWIMGGKGPYVPDVLGYQKTSQLASESVERTANTINAYIKLIAPDIIDGIAHEAMSDIRSIGGTIQGDDYAPKTLVEAASMNGTIQQLVGDVGLTNVLSTSLLQAIYEGVRDNAVTALENNWTIGENKALNELLNPDVGGDDWSDTFKPKTSNSTPKLNYDESNPSKIFQQSGSKLSERSQAAGYAWAHKVLGNLLGYAAHDALAGITQADDAAALATRLRTDRHITADEAAEIQTGAPNNFGAQAGNLTYTRNSVGVQQMFKQLYDAEYTAVTQAMTDMQTHQGWTSQQVDEKQATILFESPVAENLAVPVTKMPVGVYTQLWRYMGATRSSFEGAQDADSFVIAQRQGNLTAATVNNQKKNSIEIIKVMCTGTAPGQVPGYLLSNEKTKHLDAASADDTNQNIASFKILAEKVYEATYAQEIVRADQAYLAGQALAQKPGMQLQDGSVLDVMKAGESQGKTALNDGTGRFTDAFWKEKGKKIASGQVFAAGYNQSWLTVNTTTTANKADIKAFNRTSMAKQNKTILNIAHVKQLYTGVDKGWHVKQVTLENSEGDKKDKPGTQTITVTYEQGAAFVMTLPSMTGTYNGQKASTHVTTAQLIPMWNDQKTQAAITVDPTWVTVDNDGPQVGHYTYHLNEQGAKQVAGQIQQHLKSNSHDEIPTATQLMNLEGQLDLRPSTTMVPHFTVRPGTPQLVTGQPLTPGDWVVAPTDAAGHPLDGATVTGDLTTAQSQTPGDYQVTLTLTDPTSHETVTHQLLVTVISPEASTSASTSLVTVASESTSRLVASESSVSDWQQHQEMSQQSVNESVSLQQLTDFDSASTQQSLLDEQSLSQLGSDLATDSASTSTFLLQTQSVSLQRAVESVVTAFDHNSAQQSQLDEQSLSQLGHELTEISASQAVNSAVSAFNHNSLRQSLVDEQSLGQLGTDLAQASLSNSVMHSESESASVQQAVASEVSVFNWNSRQQLQVDEQSLQQLGSELTEISTSQAVDSTVTAFNHNSRQQALIDEQSMVQLGSELASGSASTSSSQSMSTSVAQSALKSASISLQQAVDSTVSAFSWQSLQQSQVDSSSLQQLGHELAETSLAIASATDSLEVSMSVDSVVSTFDTASNDQAKLDEQSLSALGSGLIADSTSTRTSQSTSASMQQSVDSAVSAFDTASNDQAKLDEQSLSELGSGLIADSISTRASQSASTSIQQSVDSEAAAFDTASNDQAKLDEQSLSELGSGLIADSTSTRTSQSASTSIQQSVDSEAAAFDTASNDQAKLDEQSLSELGSDLIADSTSTRASQSASTSMQQSVDSEAAAFDAASNDQAQLDEHSLSELGSGLVADSTSTRTSQSASASMQQLVHSEITAFDSASNDQAKLDEQSLSELGSGLIADSTSTRTSQSASTSMQQSVDSAISAFDTVSNDQAKLDEQSLSGLESGLVADSISTRASQSASTSIQQSVDSEATAFDTASNDQAKLDEQSLSVLGSGLIADLISTWASQSASTSIQQSVDSAVLAFDTASNDQAKLDEASLSELGSGMIADSTSTRTSQSASASIQQSVDSAISAFDTVSNDQAKLDEQSLSGLESGLVADSISTWASQSASTSIQQSVDSAVSAFDTASNDQAKLDEESLSELENGLMVDSTSTRASQSASASLQQVVDSVTSVFTWSSIQQSQSEDRVLSELAVSLVVDAAQRSLSATLAAFTSTSLQQALTDDQSLSQWGADLALTSLSLASQATGHGPTSPASGTQVTGPDSQTTTVPHGDHPVDETGDETIAGTINGDQPTAPVVTGPGAGATGDVTPTLPGNGPSLSHLIPDESHSHPVLNGPVSLGASDRVPTAHISASAPTVGQLDAGVLAQPQGRTRLPLMAAAAAATVNRGGKGHQAHTRRAFKRFSVTAIRKIGLYRMPTFSPHQRLAWYHKQTASLQAQFIVIGVFMSKHGRLRYKVRDVNHGSKTYGMEGYITARWDYVQPTYYVDRTYTKVLVMKPTGVNGYRLPNLTDKRQHYAQGQQLTVRRLVHYHLTTRFQLTNGQYVTANRQLVRATPPKHWLSVLSSPSRHAHRWHYAPVTGQSSWIVSKVNFVELS